MSEKSLLRDFIIIDENGEEHEEHGTDFDDAAKRFAEESDPRNDMRIASSGRGEDFFISDLATGEIKTIRISGEPIIEYSVEEI